MPTSDRHAFVPLAVTWFLRQDHPSCELLVVDDGRLPLADLLPQDSRVRYYRLDRKLPLGAKRNLACDAARGDVIVHWDDDDWSAPWRVSYQVAALENAGADICGLDRVLFYDPLGRRAWRYSFPRSVRPWVYGATLCYRKAVWAANRFPEVNVGEDTRFVWGVRGAKVIPLDDPRCFVGTVHRGNTSPKRTHDPRWESIPAGEVEALLGDARHDYRAALNSTQALAGAH